MMSKTIKLLLVAMLVSLFSHYCYSSIRVDSIYIHQVYQSDTADVYLIIRNLVLPASCGLVSSNTTLVSNSIQTLLCYNYPGSATRPCHSNDEVFIGKYVSGSYDVTVYINAVEEQDSTCTNPTRQDTFYLNFSVITGLSEVTGIENNWRVYPNPSNDYITIQCESEKESDLHITINSIDGRVMYELEQPSCIRKCSSSINISRYPKGVYIAHVTIGSDSKSIKFLKF